MSAWIDRVTRRLLAHARRVMPNDRAAWGEAMSSELDHVARHERLVWAAGCLLASYVERSRQMTQRIAGLSRWVLGLELAVCFVWPTLLLAALLWSGAWGFSGGYRSAAWLASMFVATVLGPLGLVLAFKVLVLGRSMFGSISLTALGLSAAWAFVAFTMQAADDDWSRPAINSWVLLALLPALGTAHLVYAARVSCHNGTRAA